MSTPPLPLFSTLSSPRDHSETKAAATLTPPPHPPSLPQDPEARTLIVGYAIAGYYAISAWSQVLVWPTVEAPYCQFSPVSANTLNSVVLLLTNGCPAPQITTAGRSPSPSGS